MFSLQFKLRRSLPAWLFGWLSGICGTARKENRIGILVLKVPRMQDSDAIVCLRWADWVALNDRFGDGKVSLSVRTPLDEYRQCAVGEGDLHCTDRILQPEVSRE